MCDVHGLFFIKSHEVLKCFIYLNKKWVQECHMLYGLNVWKSWHVGNCVICTIRWESLWKCLKMS